MMRVAPHRIGRKPHLNQSLVRKSLAQLTGQLVRLHVKPGPFPLVVHRHFDHRKSLAPKLRIDHRVQRRNLAVAKAEQPLVAERGAPQWEVECKWFWTKQAAGQSWQTNRAVWVLMEKAMERINLMECWDSCRGSEGEAVAQSRRNQGFLEEKERELS